MSNMQEQVIHWLIELGQQHGESFKLDDEHTLKLASDEHTLIITAPPRSEMLYLTVILCDLPASNKEAVYELALGLNLHQEKTHGATIAIDALANAFVLSYCSETAHLSFNDFNNIINNLLETSQGIAIQLQSAPESNHTEMSVFPPGLDMRMAVKP